MPGKLSRLVSNPEETEASIDTETAALAVTVAQVAISDSEYAIISSQHNAVRGYAGVDITLYRLRSLPESRIESAHLHSKMTSLPTNESDQTVSQSKEVYNGSVVSLPSHMCKDTSTYWKDEERYQLPKDEEGYQYILVVICAFSRWIELFQLRPQLQTKLHAVFISTLVDGELPIDFEPTMAQLSLTIS